MNGHLTKVIVTKVNRSKCFFPPIRIHIIRPIVGERNFFSSSFTDFCSHLMMLPFIIYVPQIKVDVHLLVSLYPRSAGHPIFPSMVHALNGKSLKGLRDKLWDVVVQNMGIVLGFTTPGERVL